MYLRLIVFWPSAFAFGPVCPAATVDTACAIVGSCVPVPSTRSVARMFLMTATAVFSVALHVPLAQTGSAFMVQSGAVILGRVMLQLTTV